VPDDVIHVSGFCSNDEGIVKVTLCSTATYQGTVHSLRPHTFHKIHHIYCRLRQSESLLDVVQVDRMCHEGALVSAPGDLILLNVWEV
jgi:hypothetical protein